MFFGLRQLPAKLLSVSKDEATQVPAALGLFSLQETDLASPFVQQFAIRSPSEGSRRQQKAVDGGRRVEEYEISLLMLKCQNSEEAGSTKGEQHVVTQASKR